jgi:hypothetical protein
MTPAKKDLTTVVNQRAIMNRSVAFCVWALICVYKECSNAINLEG